MAALRIGAPLGAPGKDKVVHRGTDAAGKEWAVATLKRGGASAAKFQAEAGFLRRAAALQLAPRVSEALSDLAKGRLVMELLDGGTLKDVLRRQGGSLRPVQQQRLVEILEALGGPGCELCHGDLGNPLNFCEDSTGVFHVIDFGFAHEISPRDREVLGDSPRLNLMAVGNLVWGIRSDGDDGRSLWRTPPDILLAAYRAYKREVGLKDMQDPHDRRGGSAAAPAAAAAGVSLAGSSSAPMARSQERAGGKKRSRGKAHASGAVPAGGEAIPIDVELEQVEKVEEVVEVVEAGALGRRRTRSSRLGAGTTAMA